MEARLLLRSEVGKWSLGSDRASVTFNLNPALPLGEGGDYFCCLSYIEFLQLNLEWEDDCWFQIGTPEETGHVIWGMKYTFRIGDTLLAHLLEEVGEKLTSIEEFDGEYKSSVKQRAGGTIATYVSIMTRTKALKISKNLQRFLGYYSNVFAPNTPHENSPMSPDFQRWMDKPLIADVDILEEIGMNQYGSETQVPDALSLQPMRRSYLQIIPLHRLSDNGIEGRKISNSPNRLQWVRVRPNTISQITFSLRWPDGDVVRVDKDFFKFIAEVIVKKRCIVSFA